MDKHGGFFLFEHFRESIFLNRQGRKLLHFCLVCGGRVVGLMGWVFGYLEPPAKELLDIGCPRKLVKG